LTYELKEKLKPGFHIITPVATVVAVIEKGVLTQKYFLSDASDTVFPYDRRCRSISLKLGGGDLLSANLALFSKCRQMRTNDFADFNFKQALCLSSWQYSTREKDSR